MSKKYLDDAGLSTLVTKIKNYVASAGGLTPSAVVDLVYPVNSIYMSVSSTSPATLFGGTWVRLKDRFLLGAGDTYTNGNTGGSATVTLTKAQLPAHTHANTISVSASQAEHRHSLYSIGNNKDGDCSGFTNSGDNGVGGPHNGSSRSLTASTQDARGRYLMDTATPSITVTKSITNASVGSGEAHNNMPPYLVVYMWKRTA